VKNYRVKEIDGKFYPQKRSLIFFWDYIRLYDRESRDWFVQSVQDNLYNGSVDYLVCKDAWGSTIWFQPEFNSLEHAKLFIEEYKKFLERKYEKRKAKYYY
jgi:hypothetical protein